MASRLDLQTNKRPLEDDSSSEDESDNEILGPTLPSVSTSHSNSQDSKRAKSEQKDVSNELQELFKSSPNYNLSYESNSVLTCLVDSPSDLTVLVTGAKNGMLTFWKRRDRTKDGKPDSSDKEDRKIGELEVIKQIVAHKGKEIVQLIVDRSSHRMASFAEGDKVVKIYDMTLLSMLKVIELAFVPNTDSLQGSCWYSKGAMSLLVISEAESCNLHLIDPVDETVKIVSNIHRSPVTCVAYNYKFDCLISGDRRGMIEYWSAENLEPPNNLNFKYKSQTDLIELVKQKSAPSQIEFSGNQDLFAIRSFPDGKIRVFDVKSGIIKGRFSESVPEYDDFRSADIKLLQNLNLQLQQQDRRLERYSSIWLNDRGDELYISTIVGIKYISLKNGKTEKIYGFKDAINQKIRFLQFKLTTTGFTHIRKDDIIANRNIQSSLRKPILILTAANSNKLFIFSDDLTDQAHYDHRLRDNKNKLAARGPNTKVENHSPTSNIRLHTSKGDITIRLFDNIVPITVKNFINLCVDGYYQNTIFHRVIKNFMIQGGDPKGDGTGGHAHGGGYIKDEFSPQLSHSKPYMVSMANAGPNTNGSQFFITTNKTPWLDNKHTIFGEVIDGFQTIKDIESSETDDQDKPVDQIVILATSLEKRT